MVNCCAFGCTSRTSNKSKKQIAEETATKRITFHVFPKEPNRRAKWIGAIYRKHWEPSATSVVCSKHFTADCFETTTGLNNTVLRNHSIPTIFPADISSPTYLKNLHGVPPTYMAYTKRQGDKMSSTHSKDEMISSEKDRVKIKTENIISEEINEDPLNAQGLEPQIDSVNCTSNWNSGEDIDSEDNYCIVKTEEETLQINTVTPYTCEICGATYDGLASYEVHLEEKHETHNIHTEEMPYKIDECTTSFTARDSLKKHKCDVCTSSFTGSSSLRRHKRTHTGEKPYKCDECTSRFAQNGSLKMHKRIHTGEKPYKCDECTSSFSVSGNLKMHKRFHLGEKPYKCDECTLSFIQKSDLKKHKRIHTREKLYKCDGCMLSFTQSRHLKKHKRSHIGE